MNKSITSSKTIDNTIIAVHWRLSIVRNKMANLIIELMLCLCAFFAYHCSYVKLLQLFSLLSQFLNRSNPVHCQNHRAFCWIKNRGLFLDQAQNHFNLCIMYIKSKFYESWNCEFQTILLWFPRNSGKFEAGNIFWKLFCSEDRAKICHYIRHVT